jgi:Ser/Thr protein kinase RdoA (MazF antagonist)
LAKDSDLFTTIANQFAVDQWQLDVFTRRPGRIVFRVAGDDSDLVVKGSTRSGDFDQEVRAIETLSGMGIPVSEVVLVESGPPALLVCRWVEGKPLSADSVPEVLHEVGRILRRIHHVSAEGPFSGHPTIQAWIEHWYGLVIAWWAESGGLGADSARIADDWLAEVRPVLAGRDGCLMLFDGRPDHFLVGPDGQVRLIDVADLQAGEAAMDLAVLELDAPGILDVVIEGYGAIETEREAFGVLVPFLVFLRALSAAEWQGRELGDADQSRRYLGKASAMLNQRVC